MITAGRKLSGAVLLAGAMLGADAGAAPDCSDPYILARRVPECSAANELADSLQKIRAEEVRLAQARVKGVLPGSAVNFDGAAARAGEPEAVAAGPADQSSARPALARSEAPAGVAVPSPASEPARGEAFRFWSFQGLFQAVWLADLSSTIKVLKQGGRELNPLYTLFGAKSLAGVIVSIIFVHVLLTGLLWWMYRSMSTLDPAERKRREWLILAVSLIATLAHLLGAVHNRGQFRP